MRDVILAKSAGFCFGVQRAVEETLKIKESRNKKIYTLGPLIHNNDVVSYLEENDIFSVEYDKLDQLSEGDTIIIRSHGVSKEVMENLKSRGLEVVDATCPFVTKIHKKVEKYSDEGYNIVILGDKNHPEVIGINGWCHNKSIITKSGNFEESLPKKICVVSQTTEKEENWENMIKNLSTKCSEVLAFNTICSATEVRQKSAYELSKEVDCMIVIGGRNSSNTTKLYEISKANCRKTIHIENAKELPKEIIEDKNLRKIGVTAGASTPDWVIKEVINLMGDNSDMEDQLVLMNEFDKKFKIGDEVSGEILSINNDEIIISLVGYKADGVISKEELTTDLTKELTDLFKIGDKISAKVIKLRNKDGNVVLSTLEYEKEVANKELEEMFNSKAKFLVNVKDKNSKGLIVEYKGIRIFIPVSHISRKFTKDINDFSQETLDIALLEYNKEDSFKNIGSRRVIEEETETLRRKEIFNELNVDDLIDVEIKRFTNFGAFGEYKGIDCLIHISEISKYRINSPEEVLKVGEIVKAKVISVNNETEKIALSIKELQADPWDNITDKYPEGTIVLGKVVRVTDFGAFVELEPGVDGMIHISKICYERINHPSDKLEIGQSVKAKILGVDGENRKISLSLKDI